VAKKNNTDNTSPSAPKRAAAPRRTTNRADTAPLDTAAEMSGGTTFDDPRPTPDEIAQAAYQRYLSRGGGHGQDFDDWIAAERELTSKR
jgi:Protein of unknown function (DUF2934)